MGSSTPLLAAAAEAPLGFGLANLLLVIAAAWVAGRLVERLGYPAILGELMAGVILGPPLLGLLQGDEGLRVLANLGVLLMMLYIGVEIDPADLQRASRPGLLAAAGGFIIPAGLGYALIVLTGGSVIAALFVGSAMGVTSLATKSRILVDLRLLDTRIAHVLMAAALLSDTATLLVFAGIVGFGAQGTIDVADITQVAGSAAGFFAVAGLLGIVVIPWLGRQLRERGWTDRSLVFALVVAIGLLFAELAELAGLHAILGAFIAGLFLREQVLGRRATVEAQRMLRDASLGFLAPIFFVTAGFQIDLGVFVTDLPLLLAVIVLATLGKILGTSLFYQWSGHGWREGLTVGAAMNGRGAVEIIVAEIGLQLGLLPPDLFTILVVMAIVTTATVPVLLTLGVRWLRSHGELVEAEGRRRDVVIVGAGPVARLLAELLGPDAPITLVDANPVRCLQARRKGLRTVTGDALDMDVLERAATGSARTFLAITPNPETNVLAAQLAREEFLVPDVYVSLGGETARSLEALLQRIDATPLFGSEVDLTRWDRWVADEEAVTVRLRAEAGGGDVHQRLRDGKLGLPLTVHRDGRYVPFAGVDDLVAGDEFTILARAGDVPLLGPDGDLDGVVAADAAGTQDVEADVPEVVPGDA